MLLLSQFFDRFHLRQVVGFVAVISLAFTVEANAQGGSPVPGGWTPLPIQTDPSVSAPVPGGERIDTSGGARGLSSGTQAATSKYAQLPLSLSDAKSRMQELNTMASIAKSQDVLEAVNRLSEWLGDMCDAHNKMANTFARHDQTKNQALAERQAVQKFSQVRNQAQLLKAQLLINQHRFPEALTPLVDIVTAEPLSSTGQSAYKKLRELGFSEEASPVSESSQSQGSGSAMTTMFTTESVKNAGAGSHSRNASTASAPGFRRVH